MSDINSVTVIGRLTKDMEVSYTNSGTAIGKFSLAVNKEFVKDGEKKKTVSYFDVVLWGNAATALQPYLLKGKMIGVQGELVQQRWEKDGQARSKVEITAQSIQLLGGGQGKTGQAEPQGVDADGIPF